MPLGKKGRTSRGFAYVEFVDTYGNECTLQASSGIQDTDDADVEDHYFWYPGSSRVWLGVARPNPKILRSVAHARGIPLLDDNGYPDPNIEISGWQPFMIPDEVNISTRMHLNREQVLGLINRLRDWLERADGDFEGPGAVPKEYACSHCAWRSPHLDKTIPWYEIDGVLSKLEPGSEVPAGGCPKCGGFVYPCVLGIN
jgi:hypothetical protein